MWLGYHTNGFAHHRLEDALVILADLGYEGVAITLDYQALNPYADDLAHQIVAIRRLLERLKLQCVVETGARFLLDPWRKHQPTLLDPDPSARERRRDFLRRAIRISQEIASPVVSLWSGTAASAEPDSVLLGRLAEECLRLADEAAAAGIRLAFEPEPGMFIATLEDFARLERLVRHPAFGLTADIGHLHCQGEVPIPQRLRAWQRILWHVHLEDMRRGQHEHLMFGEGEIDFPPILSTLREIGYPGGVCVELSRHSHDAVNAARKAIAFLRAGSGRSEPPSQADN
jgi:sugar phosphate isomerase/epimerase